MSAQRSTKGSTKGRILLLGALGLLLAVALVLMLESAAGPPGADGEQGATPASATPVDDGPRGGTILAEATPAAADPAPMDVPPAAAPAADEPACTVKVLARLAGIPPARPTPVATRLEFGISTSRNELGEAWKEFETLPDGSAEFEVPWVELAPGEDGKARRLWLRSSGPGLLTRVARQWGPKESGATVMLSVTVQPGALVSGRILGPDGEPAAGRVDWWWFGEEGITSSSVGFAGADGLFTGELLREGTHGLLASATSAEGPEAGSFFFPQQMDLGTGFSELFEVRFDEPVPFIEVHVSGPGVLHGRVIDGAGSPAAGLSLLAILAELDDEQGSLRPPYPRTREVEQEGRGHHWITAVTDGDGGFDLRGLRNDLYNIRAVLDGRSSSGYPVLLTGRPVPSHGDPLELVLSRPHLAIHVRRADGSAPEEALVVHSVARWGGTLDEWPEDPGVLVALAPRHAHLAGWRGPYLRAKSTGPGEFIVELADKLPADGALELDVGLLGGEVPWQRVPVEVPPGAGRVDVDLVLPEPAPKGVLVLDVVDAQGAALVKQLRVRLVDPGSGVVLVDAPCDYTDEDDWPMRFELPEGGYRLLVEGHPWIDDHHGTLMRRRGHGLHEQLVQVPAGGETRVTATPGEAARLAVRILGSASEADRQAVRADLRGDDNEEYVAYWAPHVSLRLEREGRWPEAPDFARTAMEGTSAAGTHLFSSVVFGQEQTSEPLSPGDYTLVATTRGGRELRREITLVPGETLSLTLSFE